MPHRIVIAPEARDQLDSLHSYIAAVASAEIATRFVDGILGYIATLREFLERGPSRDDLRPGLRTLAWRRRVTIAFMVDRRDMVVIGVFYGGRDFEALLADN